MTQHKEVFIVSASRTPLGSFNGSLASKSAVELGALVTKHCLEKINNPKVDEVIFGNVLSAGLGQNPARQVGIKAGLGDSVPCTTVNKVCASGMKSVMMGAQQILLGLSDTVVCGGMESMTNVPFYSKNTRFGAKYGHQELTDGIVSDGLWDVYNEYLMGNAAELCASEHALTREAQDDYAIESYTRAQLATKQGLFKNEICPVVIPGRRGQPDTIVDTDDEVKNLNATKLRAMKPAFSSDGTVTAPNSSPLSDGAACIVLMSGETMTQLGLSPLARLCGWADAAKEPERFTEAPSLAIPKALSRAGVKMEEVNSFEINEAFSVVALANMKILGLDSSKVNPRGGAVAMGHPLGCSGARILVTLIYSLLGDDERTGCAGICNGGGGASAMVLSVMKSRPNGSRL